MSNSSQVLCLDFCEPIAVIFNTNRVYLIIYTIIIIEVLLAQGRKKIKEQESEIDKVIQEAQRKVVSVRTFWRDKIYQEQSRAGKIVKRAVCTCNYDWK